MVDEEDNYYLDFLVKAAPDILWCDVQDVGSYEGTVYAVGKYQGKIVLFECGYGSCSGCGAWGEGGEPTSLKEVLGYSEQFDSAIDAMKFARGDWDTGYDRPDLGRVVDAIVSASELQFVGPKEKADA